MTIQTLPELAAEAAKAAYAAATHALVAAHGVAQDAS